MVVAVHCKITPGHPPQQVPVEGLAWEYFCKKSLEIKVELGWGNTCPVMPRVIGFLLQEFPHTANPTQPLRLVSQVPESKHLRF